MKKLLLILLCFPMIGFGQWNYGFGGQNRNNHLSKDNIKGKVKEIVETKFEAKKVIGELKKSDLKGQWIYRYDKDGNMLEQIWYRKNGELGSQETFKYDDNGNQTERNFCCNYKGKPSNSSYKYKYNDGVLNEKTEYKDGKLRFRYKYDKNGKETEQSRYELSGTFAGEVNQKYTFEYDIDGNLTKESKYDKYGELIWWYKVKYGEDGKQINLKYNKDGKLILRYEYNFDVDSNLTKESKYDEYGELNWWFEYNYDDYGNKNEQSDYNSKGELQSKYKYKYELYEKNNWTIRTEFTSYNIDKKLTNEKPTTITERKIQYY